MSYRRPAGTIDVSSIGKLYMRGRTQGAFRYRSLREELTRPRGKRSKESDTFWALKDITFQVDPGEVVGVIGRNGAGKSTMLKVLSRIIAPTIGTALIYGRIGSLLEVGTGFHPELTGRENIFLSGAVLGMRSAEIRSDLDDIVEFAGVGAFLDTPVKRLSTGMFLRLAFSVAAHLRSEILLVDEVLAVGDADFQKKCLESMSELGRSGRTVFFVSHSMPAVLRLCPRVLLLDGGNLIADGSASDVVSTYLTSGLGTSAAREWNESTGPGDSVVTLRSVRVLDHDGKVADEVEITQPVRVEVSYDQHPGSTHIRPCVNLHFFNEEGVCLFITNDFNNQRWWKTPRRPGHVRAVCEIPGNLLAEGRISVLTAISSFDPTNVHALEADAVAFQVVDRTSGEGVRGPFTHDWPGVMRPMLRWTIAQPGGERIEP